MAPLGAMKAVEEKTAQLSYVPDSPSMASRTPLLEIDLDADYEISLRVRYRGDAKDFTAREIWDALAEKG